MQHPRRVRILPGDEPGGFAVRNWAGFKTDGSPVFRSVSLCLFIAVAGGLAGCTSDYSPNTYASSAVQQANKVEPDIVVGFRQVAISANGTVGAVSGGAAGGILGAQVGTGGMNAALGTVGGTAIGGLLGTAMEHIAGDTNGWDAHSDIEGNHQVHCARTDRPAAALIRDLKQRGLLSSTLVVWAGEFGRTPMTEGKTGRDHNPYGFTTWLAGGGVRGGTVYGGTDAIGLRAEEDRAHVHDVHATILRLLGLDHKRLTYVSNGRAERLTDVAGNVIEKIVA